MVFRHNMAFIGEQFNPIAEAKEDNEKNPETPSDVKEKKEGVGAELVKMKEKFETLKKSLDDIAAKIAQKFDIKDNLTPQQEKCIAKVLDTLRSPQTALLLIATSEIFMKAAEVGESLSNSANPSSPSDVMSLLDINNINMGSISTMSDLAMVAITMGPAVGKLIGELGKKYLPKKPQSSVSPA